MTELRTKLESFSEGLKQWIFERQQSRLLQLASYSSPKAPTGLDLWHAFLKSLLKDITYLDLLPLARELASLSGYSSPGSFRQWFEGTLLAQLPDEIKAGMEESLLALLSSESQWIDGSWHREIQANPLRVIHDLEELLLFPTSWEVAHFLGLLGYPYVSGQAAFQAFLRYIGPGQRLRWQDWQALLTDYFGDASKAYEADRLWNWIFHPNPSGLLPQQCQEKPDCFGCPLKETCHFYEKNRLRSKREAMEGSLLIDRAEDKSNEELFSYLLKDSYNASPLQKELIEGFPKMPQVPGVDDKRSGNDQKFLHDFQAVLAICTRFHSSQPLEEGQTFSASSQVFEHFRYSLGLKKQESFYILILNKSFTIIRLEEVSRGLLDQSLVHPREVFANALQLRAASILLIHNHPTGNLTPSEEDKRTTQRLMEAGNILGIDVLDHLIVSARGYYSFDENGLMQALGV